MDNVNRHIHIYDVLVSRNKQHLSLYFSSTARGKICREKYVTIDMWESYKDVANTYFPNTAIAVDPFHVVPHLTKGFERLEVYLKKNTGNLIENVLTMRLVRDFIKLQNHLKTPGYGSMMNLQLFSLIGRKKY